MWQSAADRIASTTVSACLVVLVVCVLVLAAGPIDTSDFWFHIKMGEVYASEGPWPDGDPLLHTAKPSAPVQHEWFFGVILHGLAAVLGFQGLRVLHCLSVLGILALVCSIFRRASASFVLAGLGVCVFVVLAWWRLIQLRPDLFSIAASLLLYRLLLEPDAAPGRARIIASTLLLLLWANVHSLFAVGPLLIGAGWVGMLLRTQLALRVSSTLGSGSESLPAETQSTLRRWASSDAEKRRGVAIALALGLLASLLNPRGLAQHLTYFTSSRDAALTSIRDEWTRFDPTAWEHYGTAAGQLAWATTDVLLLMLLAVAILGAFRLGSRRSAVWLVRVDPLLLALASASAFAMLVSIRFLWMSVFVLLFLLAFARVGVSQWTSRARHALAASAALAALSLCVVQLQEGGLRSRLSRLPTTVASYLGTPFQTRGYYTHAVRFLRDTQVTGLLYNPYSMGGFLGYWVTPRLKTFIDGRTEHYEAGLLDEYFRIGLGREVLPGESALEALDRRRVDFFIGVGLPPPSNRTYTTARLERAPGWILVSRSLTHAIYMRTLPRNAENLARIAEYYAAQDVPFEANRGLDPELVRRTRSEWAAAHGMLLPDHERALRDRRAQDPDRRHAALEELGWNSLLLGSYEAGEAIDRESIALRPDARAPRRRLVYRLLRLDRPDEALAEATRLLDLDREDPRSQAFARLARNSLRQRRASTGASYARRARGYASRRRTDPLEPERNWLIPLDAAFDRLPLLSAAERQACCPSDALSGELLP